MADGELSQAIVQQSLAEQADQVPIDNVPLQPTYNEAAPAVEQNVSQTTDDSQKLTEEVTKVFIDSDSDDNTEEEILLKNGGLTYSDHNYDVPIKSHRTICKSSESFPEIGPLDDFGNPLPVHVSQKGSALIPPETIHQPSFQVNSKPVTPQGMQKQFVNYNPVGTPQEHPRTVPSIVARAPALRDGSYRVAMSSEASPSFGTYIPAPRSNNVYSTMRQQGNGATIRARVVDQTAQIGQTNYSVQQHSHHIPVVGNQTPARSAIVNRGGRTGTYFGSTGTYQPVNTAPTTTVRRMNLVRTPVTSTLPSTRTTLRTYSKGLVDDHVNDHPSHSTIGQQQPHHQHHVPNVLPPPQRQTPDMAPHRMTLEQRQQQQRLAVQNRTTTSFAHSEIPGGAVATGIERNERVGGIAPMLVAGRSGGRNLLMRGRTGSTGARRREDLEGLPVGTLGNGPTQITQHQVSHRSPQRSTVNIQQQQHLHHQHHLQPHLNTELASSSTPVSAIENYSNASLQQYQHKSLPISPRKIQLTDTSYSTPMSSGIQVDQQLPAQLTEDPKDSTISSAQTMPTSSASGSGVTSGIPTIMRVSPMKPSSDVLKMTPPHRRTQEQRHALLTKHLDKDKMAATLTSASSTTPSQQQVTAKIFSAVGEGDQQVASVVADVTAAATAASVPNPATSHILANEKILKQREYLMDQATKEKVEISRLAKDLKLSAEQVDAQQQQKQLQQQAFIQQHHQQLRHQGNRHLQQSPEKWTESKDVNAIFIQTKIHTIQKQIKTDPVLDERPEDKKKVPINHASPHHHHHQVQGDGLMNSVGGVTVLRPGQSVPYPQQGVSDVPTPRNRGRPRGSLNRNSLGNGIDGENVRPPQGHKGVRTLVPVKERAQRQGGVKMLGAAGSGHDSENQRPKAEKQKSNENSDSESDGNEEYGDDWEMRCHCGMTHGSGACIECCRCKKWQHTLCMGLIPGQEPEDYFCEKCQPRLLALSKSEAARIQNAELKKLARLAALAKKSRKSGTKQQTPTSKQRQGKKRFSTTPKINTTPYTDLNEYSRAAVKLLKLLGPTEQATAVLKDAKSKNQSQRMYVTEVHEGIVTTKAISSREVITELNGYICLPEECDRQHGKTKFTFQYDGLLKGPRGEHISDFSSNQLLCIDARKNKDNDAKYVRRSCAPNAVFKHVLDDRGVLGVMIVSLIDIPYNTEITLPFDNDYRECLSPLECARHFEDVSICQCEQQRLIAMKEREMEMRERLIRNPIEMINGKTTKLISPVSTKEIGNVEISTKRNEVETKKEELVDKVESETVETPEVKKRKGRPSRGSAKETLKSPVSPKKEESVWASLAEKPKPLSREEKRAQQYEELFLKQAEEEQKKKKKGFKKTAKSPEEKETVVVEKRTSARMAKTSISSTASIETTKEGKSTPTRELSARQKKKRESEAATISSSSPASQLIPPVKRWKAEAAKEAAAKEVAEKEKRSPMLFKKHFMRRHNAETRKATEEDAVLNSSPTKKMRRTTNDEKTKFLLSEVLFEFGENRKLIKIVEDFDLLGMKDDDLLPPQNDWINNITEAKEEEEEEEEDNKVETKIIGDEEKNEDEEKLNNSEVAEDHELVAGPVKKERKRISFTEYKKRKNTGTSVKEEGVNKPSSSGSQKGFIPSTEGTSSQSLTLPMISLDSKSNDGHGEENLLKSLKDRILKTGNSVCGGNGEVPSTPSCSTSEFITPADESPRHSMSLRERIDSEFGFLKGTDAPSPPPPPPPQRKKDNESPSTRTRGSR